ncbi:L-fucose mutarotase [Paenibacillus pasadenensis]|uniref:L-fucose mutarotase n=1 Tax=Paenibacillus pasadenensis TaxID=217090 RepID=A0A2N5N8Q3_9BACL|nr:MULTISPECIES: L-fucose mutarotase [Paenibacillus]PLT46703.1 L-fucose mutarotase [Paenibacillus pasadenensis]QGG57090.1 L-fucose mutarotase [Paenibacillus sp. B01]
MLKGISPLLSPELLHALRAMGHGDELVLADVNFPAASTAARLVRADGHGIPELLDAILTLLPVDTYVPQPAVVMAVVPGDPPAPAVWQQYRELLRRHERREVDIAELERFAFYERTRRAYAVVATSEAAPYGNLILTKGVVRI